MSDEEIDDILYGKYDCYKADVKNALFILADKDEVKYQAMVLELATKIKRINDA